MWHASVALISLKAMEPVPSARWRPAVRYELERFARGLLHGVGEKEERVEIENVALHLRRPLTQAEIDQLPAEWLAAPAVDLA